MGQRRDPAGGVGDVLASSGLHRMVLLYILTLSMPAVQEN